MSAPRNSLALRMRLALCLELGAGMAVVDPLLEGGGRLKHHHPARRDRNLGTGLRIAPNALAFFRTKKELNEDNFTVSPFSKRSVISFNTSSTSADDSVRDNPTFR